VTFSLIFWCHDNESDDNLQNDTRENDNHKKGFNHNTQ
jgi:hypothetical protein